MLLSGSTVLASAAGGVLTKYALLSEARFYPARESLGGGRFNLSGQNLPGSQLDQYGLVKLDAGTLVYDLSLKEFSYSGDLSLIPSSVGDGTYHPAYLLAWGKMGLRTGGEGFFPAPSLNDQERRSAGFTDTVYEGALLLLVPNPNEQTKVWLGFVPTGPLGSEGCLFSVPVEPTVVAVDPAPQNLAPGKNLGSSEQLLAQTSIKLSEIPASDQVNFQRWVREHSEIVVLGKEEFDFIDNLRGDMGFVEKSPGVVYARIWAEVYSVNNGNGVCWNASLIKELIDKANIQLDTWIDHHGDTLGYPRLTASIYDYEATEDKDGNVINNPSNQNLIFTNPYDQPLTIIASVDGEIYTFSLYRGADQVQQISGFETKEIVAQEALPVQEWLDSLAKQYEVSATNIVLRSDLNGGIATLSGNTIPGVTKAYVPSGDSVNIAYHGDEPLPSYFSPSVRFWESLGYIDGWAAKYDLTKLIVATVMQIESCGYIKAGSGAGAIGLFQGMPDKYGLSRPPIYSLSDEGSYAPDVNAKALAYYRSGLDIALSRGFTGIEALAQAARGYNGGHGVIGRAGVAETSSYYVNFKAYYLGPDGGGTQAASRIAFIESTRMCLDGAAWLKDESFAWLQQKGFDYLLYPKVDSVDRVMEVLKPYAELVNGASVSHIPYCLSCYREPDGDWVLWYGGISQPQASPYGLTCAGFVIQAGRLIFQRPWTLYELGARRDKPGELKDITSDRFYFGYDLVRSIADRVPGSSVFKIEGYEDNLGYGSAYWQTLSGSMSSSSVYFVDVIRSAKTMSRNDSHVAMAIRLQDGSVLVYEAVTSGVGVKTWEDFTAKYGEDTYLFLMECPLSQ